MHADAVSFTLLPFSENPSASKAMVRIPNGVVYVSTTEPPTETVVTTEYRFGDVGDQSFGLDDDHLCVTAPVFPAVTAVAAARSPSPTAAPEASRTVLASVTDWSVVASFWTVTPMLTVALVDDTCGVVTRVPV